MCLNCLLRWVVGWYCCCACCQVLRLSSKSHWDVPIDIPLGAGLTKRVHMLLHHPTPPAFDGPEGRNLLRYRQHAASVLCHT